jgi:protein-tyrosine phosphatase
MNILIVCTANINRSFMAERILKGHLKKQGMSHVHVSSAALLDMQGAEADPVAAELLRENGYDGSGHQSSLLTESRIDGADLILVMEDSQMRLILDQFPQAGVRIRLLKSYSEDYAESDQEIRDPYRMSIYHYRLCFSQIYLAVRGLLKSLSKKG